MINKLVTRECDLPNLKILWHFEILTWKSVGKCKCAISWKELIVEQNGWKFGTQGTTVHICRVLLMPDSFILVWGHSVHSAKFPMLRSSKGYYSGFHSISTKFYCKYVGCEGIQSLAAFEICQNLKNFMALWNCFNTEPYGAGNYKKNTPRTVFIWSGPNFMVNTAVIWEYKAWICLAIWQKVKNFVSLWNFGIGVNGKPEMRNISKMVDHSVKQMKIWDSGYYSAHM